MNDEVERMNGSRGMCYEAMVVPQIGHVLHLECQWREEDGFKVDCAGRIDQTY